MKRPLRRSVSGLRQALDELRFGAGKTLNLRESLPTAQTAVTRAEAWLRQAQVDRLDEVLIVTGRGNQSDDGVPAVRNAILKLLYQLKRRGVVTIHREYTAGSFVVTLAPIRALWETPRRQKERGTPAAASAERSSLEGLDPGARAGLRELAERALHELGVKDDAKFVEGEMLRQFAALAASIAQGPDRERRLRSAILAAIDQQD